MPRDKKLGPDLEELQALYTERRMDYAKRATILFKVQLAIILHQGRHMQLASAVSRQNLYHYVLVNAHSSTHEW